MSSKPTTSVTGKKSPNVFKLPKNDFTRKIKDFDTFTKIVGDLGKIIVAKGFEKLPKVQCIVQSGHTAYDPILPFRFAAARDLNSRNENCLQKIPDSKEIVFICERCQTTTRTRRMTSKAPFQSE